MKAEQGTLSSYNELFISSFLKNNSSSFQCNALARRTFIICNQVIQCYEYTALASKFIITIVSIFIVIALFYVRSSFLVPIRKPSSTRMIAKIQARRLLSRNMGATVEEKEKQEGLIEFSPRSTDGRANLSPRAPSAFVQNSQLHMIKSLNDIHVLIVDDSATHRRILGRMLERLGAPHTDIEDGEDVFVALVNAVPKIDLILLDVQMARSNGIVVCTQLKNAKLKIPVGAVTSFFSIAEKEKYENAGFSFVLSKPFTQQVLATAMSRALSQDTDASKTVPSTSSAMSHHR